MHIMIADEADQDGEKDFLVFSAVFFPSDSLIKLHTGVAALRNQYNYHADDLLKSSTGSKPNQVSREQHAEIKNKVLELASKNCCKVCCYVIPNDIAAGQDLSNRMKFGTNTLLAKFDQFLVEAKSAAGIAYFDRSTDYKQDNYFKGVFRNGIPQGDGSDKPLRRIVAIDSTGIGHSHLISITDIVVGAFRFVVNEPDKDQVGAVLMRQIAKLMWGKSVEGILHPRERGLCIRPRNIKAVKYQADVDALIRRIEVYCKE